MGKLTSSLSATLNSAGGGGGSPATLVLFGTPGAVLDGHEFSFTPSRSGGTAPFVFSVDEGALPSWATLDEGTGEISGTADGVATTDLTVGVSSADSQTASLEISIQVLEATAGRFDEFYDVDSRLNSSNTVVTFPASPGRGSKASSYATENYIDPISNLRIYRATSVADVTNASASFMRHEYSRKQAFNCDNTKFIARGSGGFWYLYDAATFERIPGGRTSTTGKDALGGATTQQFGADCEAMWHPTDPNKLWRTDTNGSLTWYEFDITTKVTTTLFDFTGRVAAVGLTGATRAWFGGEGRCSDDGRYWCFSMQNSTFNQVGIMTYDRQTDTIIAALPCTSNPNNVSISPLGNYGIVAWSNSNDLTLSQAEAANINSTNGTRAYTRDLTSFKQLSYYGEHADTALDAEGNEVYVSVNYNNSKMPDVPDGGTYYRDCATGTAVALPYNTYSTVGHSVHFSGCMKDKPGWILVGAFGSTPGNYLDGTVFLQELVPTDSRILRLAYHHSDVVDYWSEPQPTISNDGSMVLMASDMDGGPEWESYMIGLASWHIPTAGDVELSAPINTSIPSTSGSLVVGATRTVTTGGWTGNPTPTYSYQWQESVASVWTNRGTNSSSFTPANAGTFRVVVTATNSEGSATATSSTFTMVDAAVGPTLRASTLAAATGANTVTSSDITTASGDCLGVFVIWQGTDPMPTITDNKDNTFAQYSTSAGATNGGFTYRIGVALCYGDVSVGGSGHTFTATKTSSYPTIIPFSVQGANAGAPVDAYAAAQDTVSPYSSGNLTTTGDARLVLSGISSYDSTSFSVDSPYAIIRSAVLSQVTYWTAAMASYEQPSAGATSASWTLSPSIQAALASIAFKS